MRTSRSQHDFQSHWITPDGSIAISKADKECSVRHLATPHGLVETMLGCWCCYAGCIFFVQNLGMSENGVYPQL